MTRDTRKISELHNWELNPRKIDPKNFKLLIKKIKRWGQFKPVIITNDGEVIGGNMRLNAYRKLGIEDIWVSVVNPKSEAEKTEIAIADNESAGSWDEDLLKNLAIQFKDEIDLDDYKLDFDSKSWMTFLPDEDIKEDDAPELDEEATYSVPGEIYILGNHRLMCGDATKAEDIAKLMQDDTADIVFTDPPYNVNYIGQGKNTSNNIMNDNMDSEEFLNFLSDSFKELNKASKPTAPWYVCHSHKYGAEFQVAIKNSGRNTKTQIIWEKPSASMGWQEYRTRHEPIFYCTYPDKEVPFYSGRTHTTIWKQEPDDKALIAWLKKQLITDYNGTSTVWTLSRENVQEYTHPTQKPVALVARALTNSTKEDDIVVDFFGGSGTTLSACEQKQRKCRMMELDPKYVDVIRKRYATLVDKADDWQQATPSLITG